ncbi:MAG TPA: hypothetical protein PK239_15900 [Chitinophagales bacterium]|nr:hypothetical protein [Chitinophagales bacterium]HRK28758.1 hypothetical protein [Chitinophagales bacterium]
MIAAASYKARVLYVIGCLCLVLVSCQTSEQPNAGAATQTAPPDSSNQAANATLPNNKMNPADFTWEFEVVEDKIGTPNARIYLLYKGIRYKAGKAAGNFQTLNPADFAQPQYSVPTTALTAAWGFWAGMLTTFYAAAEGEFVNVYKRTTDAEDTNPIQPKFEKVMQFDVKSVK